MALHRYMPFRTLTSREEVSKALQSKGNYSGYINIVVTVDGEKCLLMGHRNEHDDVNSFGGTSKSDEKLIQTLKRRMMIETFGCVLPGKELKKRLYEEGTLISNENYQGHHYTAIVDLGDDEFSLEKAQKCISISRILLSAFADRPIRNPTLHAIPLRQLRMYNFHGVKRIRPLTTNFDFVVVQEGAMPAIRHIFNSTSIWDF